MPNAHVELENHEVQSEVSIPWKICLLTGAIFGVALSQGSQHDNSIWKLVRFFEFHKLNWVGFGGSGIFIVALMIWWPQHRIDARRKISGLIYFLFNGMVGGYLGIAFWSFYIGVSKDGIEFLGWAWITYVWFFLTLNVVKHGVPKKN